MARKSNKSPTEIRENLEKALANAKAREAQVAAQDNPIVQNYIETRKTYAVDLAEVKRSLSGPNSFANRREALNLRLASINAGEELAQAQEQTLTALRDKTDRVIARLAKMVADGEEVSEEIANRVWSGDTVELPDMADLFKRATETENAWRANAAKNRKAEGIAISAD